MLLWPRSTLAIKNPPEWPDHVNASTMEVKLSMAMIGISSVHLLKSFIENDTLPKINVYVQTGIHLLFIVSAMGLAHGSRLTEASIAGSRLHREWDNVSRFLKQECSVAGERSY